MTTAIDEAAVEAALDEDTPFFARTCLKILPKQRKRGLIPFEMNAAQRLLDAKLAEQQAQGKPQRAIILKARQIGFSTYAQAKLIQGATRHAHTSCLVVAHDTETGGKLYAMGERMYANLPAELKPEVRSHRRTRFLHFGQKGEAWMDGEIWPDSSYFVDTAGEFESGRGGTYHRCHFSEYAFWPQAEQKHTALMQAVPDDPDTLIVIESTPNGHNHFKTLWDDAWEGRSDYIPFFWPWWKHPEYTRPFVNDAERREFRIGDIDQSPYAEEEGELHDPGPIDVMSGEHVSLSLEQLNWRRWAIANKCGGKIDKFHQEYPHDPETAFLATGSKVFEPAFVSRAMKQAEQTDPRYGRGGPIRGQIEGKHETRAGRFGPVEVPTAPFFKPARDLLPGEDAEWRLWLELGDDGKPIIPRDKMYVIGVDVSEGLPESDDDGGDPAWHAIQVIEHVSKLQVAEYRSRCDPDLLAEAALLAALLFNDAWLAIEKTGPGLQVVRKVWLDYRYRFTYFRKAHDRREEKQDDRLGWSTDRGTKPILLAGGQELLREDTHGIRSRRLVSEMLTYIRLSTGKTVPEKGKFADLLMAWLIAQQVALEKPVRQRKEHKKGGGGYKPRNPITGYRRPLYRWEEELHGAESVRSNRR